MLARISWNNNRVKCGSFVDNRILLPESEKNAWNVRNKFISDEEYNNIKNCKCVDYKTISDIDNGEIYEWYQYGSEKYGRCMYCIKTHTRRTMTMGEFYGSSTVD